MVVLTNYNDDKLSTSSEKRGVFKSFNTTVVAEGNSLLSGGKAVVARVFETERNATFHQMEHAMYQLLTTDIHIAENPTRQVLQTSSLNPRCHKVDSVPNTPVSMFLTRRNSPRLDHLKEN